MTAFPPPLPAAPPPGWWKRNWKWLAPVSAVTVICLGAGFVFAIYTLVTGLIKSQKPYQEPLAMAAADARVAAALGTPIEEGIFPNGNISTSSSSGGSSGHASFRIPIHGPKGSGTIEVEASMSSGVWSYSTLDVLIDGRPERIQLRH